MTIREEFRAYLREEQAREITESVYLNKEEKQILMACEKYLKKHATWKDKEICIEGIPCIVDNKPALAIYFWSSGTTYTYSVEADGWEEIISDNVKLSRNPKIKEDTISYLPGGKELTVNVNYFLLKTSISIDIIKDLLLINKFKPNNISIESNKVDIEYENKSDENKISNLFKVYKNVKIEFGGYYADVDNKHFIPIATLYIK